MPKHGKRKHKHRSGPAKPHKLLKYAALGKTGKLLSALAGTVAADLELYTPEGRTALHLAAEHGHLEVLKALLGSVAGSESTCMLCTQAESTDTACCRAGASAKAEDFSGNTPAHLAAQHGQAAALVLLLEVCLPAGTSTSSPAACELTGCWQAGSSADPAATNNAGESIAHLTDALLGRDADEYAARTVSDSHLQHPILDRGALPLAGATLAQCHQHCRPQSPRRGPWTLQSA